RDVEAAVERGWLVVPGPLDGFDGVGGDVELSVAFFVDDVLGRGEAHLLKLIACGFQGVDLGGGELVGGGFIPVGGAVFEGVEGEALRLDGLLPGVAWGESDALHLFSCASSVTAAAGVAAAFGEGAAESAAGGVAGAGAWGGRTGVGVRAKPETAPSTGVVAVGAR